MAEFSTQRIGAVTVRPTGWDAASEAAFEDTQLHRLSRYDPALGSPGLDRIVVAPASFLIIDLYRVTDVATGANADSLPIKAPFPLEIMAADLGCEAGTTVAIDLEVAGSSVLDAAESVTAGTASRVAPEDGSEQVDYDETININVASSGGDAAQGGQAHLYCQRL